MARDYKKEYKENLKKYECVRAFIEKGIGLRLKNKLKSENKTIASWINENATKYLDE